MDGMLSQDEINALLAGMDTSGGDAGGDAPADAPAADDASAAPVGGGSIDESLLTDSEKDAIGEVANISMGSSATTLYSLVNQKVNITTPQVELANWEHVIDNYERPCGVEFYSKERDVNGQFRGGPAWYMARGLGMRWMGVLFALFLLIAYGIIFSGVQANAVARALSFSFDFPPLVTGIILAVFALLAITRGLHGVARLMQGFVPLMAIIWVLTSLVICVMNIGQLPHVIWSIFESAFGWQEAAGGAAGYTLSQAITNGFQRSMFSNEAGMGSTPNAAAAAASWPPHPAAQGIVQMIGIFIDTLVICTASAMLILLAGNGTTYMPLEGIQLIQKAMRVLMGSWGAEFVTLVVILFAFSSIVANYIYAENNLFFLRLNNPKAIWCLRICTFATVIGGTLLSFPLMWQLADIIMACMAITNLTAILLLSPVVHTIASDYLRQRKLGVRPVFDPLRYPEIGRQLSPDAWDDVSQE